MVHMSNATNTAKTLSEQQFRQVLASLGSNTESALRQIEISRSNGYYTNADCDRLAARVINGKTLISSTEYDGPLWKF